MPTVKGTWPGRLTFKSGWGRAHARPWNDDLPRSSLRLERGTSAFLKECGEWLLENAAPDVLSVPLTTGQARPWRSAGFRMRRELAIFERDLSISIPEPEHESVELANRDASDVLVVDSLAFSGEWKMNRLGLEDALGATPTRVLLGVESDTTLVGYALVGVAASTGYLQRVAVVPAEAGKGIGRSLLRSSMRWARRKGAHTMFLNTDNAAASALYRSEEFEELSEPLVLMGMTGERPT